MNIYLVRHGQTDLNLENRIQGQLDSHSLNKTGEIQVTKLAKFLQISDYKIEAILSSPLKRAYQTAQAIAGISDFPIQIDARLQEIDCGIYEGQDIEEVKTMAYAPALEFEDAVTGTAISVTTGKQLREYYQSADPRFDYISHPEGETKRHARTRALTALSDYSRTYSSIENLFVVTHSTIMKLILSQFTISSEEQQVGTTDVIHFKMDNGILDYVGKIYTAE